MASSSFGVERGEDAADGMAIDSPSPYLKATPPPISTPSLEALPSVAARTSVVCMYNAYCEAPLKIGQRPEASWWVSGFLM